MTLYCPMCGAENRDTAKFCMQCSASMTAAPDRVCGNCGTKNPDAAKYCLNCATPLHAATPAAGLTGLLPQNFLLNGRYLIVKRLGKGGMGAVYQASDTRIGGKVWAIKEMSDAAILNPTEKQQAREAFEREAQMLALLDHVNLPKVNDFFTEGGKLYLVMDYIEGETLEARQEAINGPLPEPQVLDWARQLCEVLTYLHHRTPPIIFRDLKPGNIMVDTAGRVKLIDFGVARLFKTGQQRDTESFGTAGYAPPEQYGKGQTDARSDVYALGVTLHQLLTGYDPTLTPFNLPPARSVNPAVSAHVEQALGKATQSTPASRFQNALEFKVALTSAPKPLVKTALAATTPPMFQSNPVVQPVTASPAVTSPPIGVPKASPKPVRTKATRRVSNKAFWLATTVIGLTLGFLFAKVGQPIYSTYFGMSDIVALGITGVTLGAWFLAGPLAYVLLRRSGSFTVAWMLAQLSFWVLSGNGLSLSELWRIPSIYLPPVFFEIVAATRRQKMESYKSIILVTTLSALAGELTGELIFGWYPASISAIGAGAIAGLVGNWLGRAMRKRFGWE